MTVNKPRNSVLYLFDPLNSPETPRRDSSPDSGSDKENDLPPGEVTVFFNRIYKAPAHAASKPFQGRLIDFDTTADLVGQDEDDDGDDENENARDNCTLLPLNLEAHDIPDTTIGSPSAHRRPLAEIDLDATPRPRAFVSQPPPSHPGEPFDLDAPPSTITKAPLTSPLAEVINSINLSAMTISAPTPTGSVATEDTTASTKKHRNEAADMDEMFPQIMICPPPASEVVPESMPTSPTAHFSASGLAPPTRRPLSNNSISVDDPRRSSVDLHASFSMQMNSAEMSFDLLNDKISMLGQDSFWAGAEVDDGEFDMEEELRKMQIAALECERADRERERIEKMALVSNPIVRTPPATKQKERTPPRVFSPPVRVQLQEPADDPTTDFRQFVAVNSEDESLSCIAPPFIVETEPEISEPEVPFRLRGDALAESPPSAREESLVQTHAASVVSVPALRIVKKTWKVHGRVDSTISSDSSLSSSSSSSGSLATTALTSGGSSSSLSSCKIEPRLQSPLEVDSTNTDAIATRQAIRGVQRPPVPDSSSASATSISRGTGQPRASVAAAAEEAARRFAAAGIQRPNLARGAQVAPSVRQRGQVGGGAASRLAGQSQSQVQRSTAGGLSVARTASGSVSKAGGASMLKAPARYGSLGHAAGTASALPRPTSRLPAPGASGTVRAKATGADAGTLTGSRGTMGMKKTF